MKDQASQSNRDLAAAIAGEGAVVTKEDHIAGYKVIEVNTKWGESSKLRVTALGWRALQRLLRRSHEEKWDEVEQMAQIVMASLLETKSDALLNHLDNESAVRLQRVVNALAFGERAISPNGATPATHPAPAESPLPKPASEASCEHSPEVYPKVRSKEPVLHDLPSCSKSLAECAPSAT